MARIPHWRRRQLADAREEKDIADERRRMDLIGFEEPEEKPLDIVGWMQPMVESVKGSNHLCIACQPDTPDGYVVVLRHYLAATMPCTVCEKKLETVNVDA